MYYIKYRINRLIVYLYESSCGIVPWSSRDRSGMHVNIQMDQALSVIAGSSTVAMNRYYNVQTIAGSSMHNIRRILIIIIITIIIVVIIKMYKIQFS